MKINIKNCPVYNVLSDECDSFSENTEHICCWMNENCLLKQIVEKCNGVFDKRAIRINRFDILNLLEIEEVE